MQQDWRGKIIAIDNILNADNTTLDKVEPALALLKGIHPQVDKKLAQVSKQINNLKNLREGNVIELAAERLPEGDEKEKKRKKAILLFLKTLKELRAEIERVGDQIDAQEKGEQTGAESLAKTLGFAKGPFGIITIAAIVAVGAWVLTRGNTSQSQRMTAQPSAIITSSPSPMVTPTPTPEVSPKQSPAQKSTVQVINYGSKQIPLSELEVKTGPDCTNSPTEAAHYHARNGQSVRAADGSVIADPGACGFGKVSEVEIYEVTIESSLNRNQ